MRALFAVLLVGCAAREHWYFEDKPHEPEVHWSYEGETGPEHWGDLSPEYLIAKTGKRQSPIDIRTSLVRSADLPGIGFHYEPEPAAFVNNGHTLKHKEGPGSWIEIEGLRAPLRQFHFHTPSEHTIDGRHARAEVHLVHRGARGKYVVVAVLIEEGEPDPELEASIKAMPHKHGESATIGPAYNAIELLPAERSYHLYLGSFTTPPCTEGVLWIVMRNPIRVSPEALAEMHRIHGNNNRPTQPLHGRIPEASR